MKPGTRVVRGPDWSSKKQDNGEGFLGTIIFVPKKGSSDNKVTVIWDSGRELRYRAGQDGKYDLRVYDNGPTGVSHDSVGCDSCNKLPIVGLRFKCTTCTDFDLCSSCYMNDQHDIDHTFVRINSEETAAFALPARSKSKSKSKTAKGLFPKAEVMRGPHWKWKNDDGGDGEIGHIQSIVTWNDTSYRGGVKVKWKNDDTEKVYRVGGEGCVDIIYTRMRETASAGQYYPEHLPVVDVVNDGIVMLKPGDKVQVNLRKQEFKQLQDNESYGGWDDKMIQCIDEVGTIVQMLFEGKTCRLQYDDGTVWSVNRSALTRKHTFSPGQLIRILNDYNKVKDLQEGHGGWNEYMKQALGKCGRVIKIDSDGDIRTKIDSKTWIFSPVCVTPVENAELVEDVPELTKEDQMTDSDFSSSGSSMNDVSDAIAQIFVDMLRESPSQQQDTVSIVKAAGQGDIKMVQDIIRRDPAKVNQQFNGKTALQLASYEGHNGIVDLLLATPGINVNRVDKEGDTALHYAAFGKEAGTLSKLLDHKAKFDLCNKKQQSPLHIAVGKAAPECVRLLVSKGCDVTIKDSDDDTPMHDSVSQREGQPDIIQAVLKADSADFLVKNSKGFNVLQWAVLKDVRLAVNEILDRNKSYELVNDVMTEGFSALHIAAANDYVEIVGTLVSQASRTCDLNIRDREKRTPLIIAVSQGHKRTMEVLIRAGCEVNAQDCNGNTALHLAQTKVGSPNQLIQMKKEDSFSTEIICALLEARADVKVKNNDGVTPLDLASDSMTRQFMILISERAQATRQSTTKGRSGVVPLPAGWAEMDGRGQLLRVPLTESDGGMQQKEYENVVQKMYRTLPHAKIFRVERIQNKYCWEVYQLKKRQMEHGYGVGFSNELDLFHGTLPKIVDIICKDNLDFRLAGDRVGALFGKGTYFATESKYSDLYAQPDDNRHKFMFIVKVLAGKCAVGSPKYARPPKQFEQESNSPLYDCCVDNVKNPKIYCVFDKNQYYPEYLVEYQ